MSAYRVPARDCLRRDGCPVCAAVEATELYDLGGPRVRRCMSCGMQYLNPYPTEEVMARFHQIHDEALPLNPMLASYHQVTLKNAPESRTMLMYWRALEIMERHANKGSLLDLGCGTGKFLALARERGWQAGGLDADLAMARYAREEFGLDVRHGRLEDLDGIAPAFDAITMWDYLEHVPYPAPMLERCRALLRPGGLLVVATPDIEGLLVTLATALYNATAGRIRGPLEAVYVPSHPLYFSSATLRRLVTQCGFIPRVSLRDETDLKRVTLPGSLKTAIRGIFWVARRLGRSNRTILIAQKGSAV